MSQNADKYRLLFEKLPDGFAYHQVVTGDDGTPVDYIFLEANAAFEKMTGLKRERVIGKKVTEVLPGIEKSGFDWIGILGRVALSGEPARFESYSEPLGCWFEVCAFSDAPGYFAAVFHDITEAKKIEQKLLESEDYYRDLVNNAGDLVQCVDSAGKFVFVNQSWLYTLGYSREDLENLSLWAIIHPDSLEHCIAAFQEVLTGKAFGDVEAIFVTKQGKQIIVEGNVNVKLDEEGRFLHTRGIFRDVTERRKAEEVLKEREEEYRSLYSMLRIMSDTMPDMLWAKDLDRKYIFANMAICKNLLNAKDTKEPIGKTDLYFAKRERKAHPEQPDWHTFGELCMDSDTVSLNEMKPMQFDEYGNVKGKFLFLDVHKAPLYNDRDELIGVVGTARDVTDQKRNEEILRDNEQRAKKQRAGITELVLDESILKEETVSALNKITATISNAVDVARSSIWTFDEKGSELKCLSLYEAKTGTHSSGATLEAGKIPGYFAAIKEESKISADNAREDPRTSELTESYLKPLGIISMLDAGIIIEGELKGVICLEHVGHPRVWQADEEAFVSTAASLAAQLFLAAERKKVMETLRQSEAKYRFLTENITDVVWTVDLSGKITYISPAIEKLLRYTPEEVIGASMSEYLIREDYDVLMARIAKGLVKPPAERSPSALIQACLKNKDNRQILVEFHASWITDEEDNIIGVQGSTRDITERVQVEEALKESEMRNRALIGAIPDLLFRYSKNGFYLDAVVKDETVLHPKARNFFRQDKLIGKSIAEILPPPLARKIKSAIIKTLERGKVQLLEYSYPVYSSEHYFEARLAPIGTTEVVSIVRDITERKKHEAELKYLSFHDQLTDLYNRHYLEEEMKRLDTERQLPISIIMADLNGLKLINDTYGHSTGDEMLRRAAAILKEACRGDDIIARFGGDEFVIYLPRTPENEALEIVHRIDQAYQKEKVKEVPVTMSYGMAVKENIDQEIIDVLKEAEDRMYQNKLTESRSGKSAVLNALLKTLAEKSYETEVHTRQMQEMAIKIGEKLGLPDSELHRLKLLITLHDIGKINIQEDLLTKKDALVAADWEIMKKHPETGYRIARATEEFAHVAEDILAHHECWDGSGYPQGLKGKEIPLLARITAVADAYEVMYNGRPYKKAMSPEAIRAEFENCSGSHFDPQLVKLFLKIIK